MSGEPANEKQVKKAPGAGEVLSKALELVSGNLTSRLACDFLLKWPTFEQFQQAKPSTIKRFYYGHNIRSPQVLEKVLGLATAAQPLTTDPAIDTSPSWSPTARASASAAALLPAAAGSMVSLATGMPSL